MIKGKLVQILRNRDVTADSYGLYNVSHRTVYRTHTEHDDFMTEGEEIVYRTFHLMNSYVLYSKPKYFEKMLPDIRLSDRICEDIELYHKCIFSDNFYFKFYENLKI